MESIIVALITAVGGFIGVIFTNINSNRKIENKLATAQAVTDVKIDNLTAEVRKHNDFGTKIPVLEEQIKNIDRRVRDIENIHDQWKTQA